MTSKRQKRLINFVDEVIGALEVDIDTAISTFPGSEDAVEFAQEATDPLIANITKLAFPDTRVERELVYNQLKAVIGFIAAKSYGIGYDAASAEAMK